jgi:hypothetical protein
MESDTESLREELAALRERLDDLSRRVDPAHAPNAARSGPRASGVLDAAARGAEQAAADAAVAARLGAQADAPGTLATAYFAAAARTPDGGRVSWAFGSRVPDEAGAPTTRRAGALLGALGSEARLRLLLILWRGEKVAQQLADETGLTAGSLYHHMRQLMAHGWVDSPQRNRYVLTHAGRQALVMAWVLAQATPPNPRPS